MNANRRTALGIGALVVLAAAIGAGVFVWSGSQAATWFVLVGVPLFVVLGIGLYVRGVITRSGTSEQQFVRTRARSTAEEFQALLRQRQELRTAYPDWDPGIGAQIESAVGDFETQGVTVDRETGAFDLGKGVKSADLQEFERLSNETERLEDEVESSFREFVAGDLSRRERVLDRLSEVDLAEPSESFSAPDSSASVAECRDVLDGSREATRETVGAAIETVREMRRGGQRADDGGAIEADLADAEAALDRGEFESAVESVLEARDRLRDEFSGSFNEELDAIRDLVDAVDRANVDPHVEANSIDEVDRIDAAVSDLDSALDLSEASRHRSDLRRVCLDMVRTMEQRLVGHAETLRAADLPPGYYTEPDAVDERFAAELEDVDDLERFTERWETAATDLRDAVETASTKAAVVEAYDDVSETIEVALAERGEVVGDDLPMRHAGQFLGLYYRRNEGLEFDPSVPVLRLGDVETHDLTVEVAYEHGSERPRTATVALDGGGYSETVTVETRVAGTAAFENVPAGTHELSADPGDDAFSAIERDVTVDGDASVSVEFLEQELREQLCADVEVDMTEVLPDMRSRLESSFAEEGYVSTEMDLPVQDTHAACLLAVWSDETGYGICRSDGDVVVYDHDQIKREVTNVLRYNIDPGDRVSFAELRQNFLSAPVPDSVIRDVVGGIDGEHSVTMTETGLETNEH
ncbi:hypothetical protein [Halorubrum sp. SD683]|uniref:hypothetical protein n=1 Tax=Halorubrum sp. SD683 TaxID=1855873 RepID=UPI000A2DE152|nr:hypothetical protein [Halorubrum sp. SD683]OTE99900.1 hypothetical protein B9G49_09880 [Halorubrum sp. SD683]